MDLQKPGKIKDIGKRHANNLFNGHSKDRQAVAILDRISELEDLRRSFNIPSRDVLNAMSTDVFCNASTAAGRSVMDEIKTHRTELLAQYTKPVYTKPHDPPTSQGQERANKAAENTYHEVSEAYFCCLLHHMYRYLAKNHLPVNLQYLMRKKWQNLRDMGPTETANSYISHVLQVAKSINLLTRNY